MKFKKCHGAAITVENATPAEVEQKFREIEALQTQREQQQGKGRPILALTMSGFRVVVVGNQRFWSKKWMTFHDFLRDYIKRVVGGEWGDSELKKSPTDRHPLLNWYQQSTLYMNRHIREGGKVHAFESVGVVSAYLQLAYNLYLIAHNKRLEQRLVQRIKDRDQFLPAYYEACVFGALIRAGFEIEFENETDSSTSHCEAIALFPETGKRFSVEAKMRQESTASLDIGRQLKKALKKQAAYTRIVFLEVNIPDQPDDAGRVESLERILADIRKRESEEGTPGQPLPPAYVIVTNHPYLYFPDRPVTVWALAEGFRIPDFGWGRHFKDLREAVDAREKHSEIFALRKSWEEHQTIPATFDGDIPELAFGETLPRLRIGERYVVPDGQGQSIPATLVDADVVETEQCAYGLHKADDGRNLMVRIPLTAAELAGFRHHPETFFGTLKHNPRPSRDPLEWYDSFFEQYRKTPKEVLLDFMKSAKNFDVLRDLPQTELARLYCEGIVYDVMRSMTRKQS